MSSLQELAGIHKLSHKEVVNILDMDHSQESSRSHHHDDRPRNRSLGEHQAQGSSGIQRECVLLPVATAEIRIC